MSVQITLPDELAAQIDSVAADRAAFVEEAVVRMLREAAPALRQDDLETINRHAEELNAEAEDVLEYQVIS